MMAKKKKEKTELAVGTFDLGKNSGENPNMVSKPEPPAPIPREEIVFSSLANALNIKSDGLPYVLSEVHRFDSKLWKFFMKYKRIHRNDLLRKIVNTIFFRSKFYEIKPKDIEAIRNNDIKYLEKFEYLYDGDNKWKIFNSNNLFAVKRVEREINNPLRIYIRGLN